MALGHIDLTIGASTTRVASTHTPCSWVAILGPTNAAYVGESSSTSASVYGYKFAAASAVPLIIGPFDRAGVNLEELWISGTQNDVVHILYETF
jgi:hypothetical protein